MNRVHLTWVWFPSKARKRSSMPMREETSVSPKYWVFAEKIMVLAQANPPQCMAAHPKSGAGGGGSGLLCPLPIGPILHMPTRWALSLYSKVFGIPAGRHKLQFGGRIRELPELRSSGRPSGVRSSFFEWEQRPPEMKCLALGSAAHQWLSRGWICWRYLWRYRSASLGRAPWGLGFCWFHLCHPY